MVTIRKWEMSDAEALAKALSNKKVMDNLRDGLPYPYTEDDAKQYINAMLAADPADTFAYAVCVDGKVVGSIGAFRQENIHNRTAELGYYLAEEQWGKGIMTQAVRQLCEVIFETTDILRIFAEPFSHNAGSRRVLEKAGFNFEGTLKNNAFKNGKVLDMVMYSLTRDQYAVRPLEPDEIPEALSLAWEVFSEYEAPVCSADGIEEFRKCLNDETYLSGVEFYGAFENEKLIGEVSIRRENAHICFFFVKGEYHRRGIGTKLFGFMQRSYVKRSITVNSSPYGVEFYKALGFVPTDEEQTVNGIRFMPMVYEDKSDG